MQGFVAADEYPFAGVGDKIEIGGRDISQVLTLHIVSVWKPRSEPPRVFIFWLIQYHWSSIGYLCLGDDGTNVGDIIVGCFQIVRVPCPQLTFNALHPSRITAKADFGIYVRPGSLHQLSYA
jgi:hypothetical protein